jgi:hypothetical protein
VTAGFNLCPACDVAVLSVVLFLADQLCGYQHAATTLASFCYVARAVQPHPRISDLVQPDLVGAFVVPQPCLLQHNHVWSLDPQRLGERIPRR